MIRMIKLLIRSRECFEILNEIVEAYDAFLQTDCKVHVSNPGWLRLCNAVHHARYFRHERI